MTDKRVITQLEGQHRVAAELLARGYIPALLAERTVGHDMLVMSPKRKKFGVEVKANRRRNAWILSKRPTDDTAEIWIFIVLEPEPIFYVMTKKQVRDEWDRYQQVKPKLGGMVQGQPDRYEGRWKTLPS